MSYDYRYCPPTMYVVLFFSTYSMLNALLERRDERKKQVKKDDILQKQAEIYEVKVWKKFWDEESPGLLLYALYERGAPCMRITKGVQRYYTKIYYIIDFLVRHVRRTLFLCCFC